MRPARVPICPLHIRPSARGFTLIELLVSLGILGMTSAMIMAGLTSVRMVAERSQVQAATGESIVTAQTILRSRIENMVATTRFDTIAPITDMRGANNIVSFFAPAAPAQRPSSIARYRILRTAPGDVVIYAVSDLADGIDIYAPGQIGWKPTILVTGTDRLKIDYFGSAPPDNQPRWHDQWVERKQPPELIRVQINFRAGDKRIWPDLVVRPATTVNSACEIDNFTGRCR